MKRIRTLMLLWAATTFAVAAYGDVITVGLYADSGTSPSTQLAVLGTIDDSTLSMPPSLVDVGLVSNPVLSSDTRYWIGLSTTGASVWEWSFDTSGTGVAGEFFGNENSDFPNSDGPYQMAIALGSVTLYDNMAAAGSGADGIYSFGQLYDSFSTGPNSGAITALGVVVGNLAAVPEPSSFLLTIGALGVVIAVARRGL